MSRENSQPTTEISPNRICKIFEEKIFTRKVGNIYTENQYFFQLTKAVHVEIKSSCTSARI